MPCDTITTFTLDLGKVAPSIIDEAIKLMGLAGTHQQFSGTIAGVQVSGKINAGQLDLRGSRYELDEAKTRQIVSEFKKSYSRAVLGRQASRFGWQVKQVGKDQYQVIKR